MKRKKKINPNSMAFKSKFLPEIAIGEIYGVKGIPNIHAIRVTSINPDLGMVNGEMLGKKFAVRIDQVGGKIR